MFSLSISGGENMGLKFWPFIRLVASFAVLVVAVKFLVIVKE